MFQLQIFLSFLCYPIGLQDDQVTGGKFYTTVIDHRMKTIKASIIHGPGWHLYSMANKDDLE